MVDRAAHFGGFLAGCLLATSAFGDKLRYKVCRVSAELGPILFFALVSITLFYLVYKVSPSEDLLHVCDASPDATGPEACFTYDYSLTTRNLSANLAKHPNSGTH